MVPYVDVMTGMVATSTILGALLHRQRTGEGQRLDVALLDVAMAASVYIGQKYLAGGVLPARVGNGSLLASPSGVYPCRDGHVLVQIGSEVQWQRLCRFLGADDWLADPRFATNADRMKHVREVDEALSARTREWDKATLADALGRDGIPCGQVNTFAEAFEHPQVVHRGLAVEVEHAALGPLKLIRSPLRFSATPVEHRPVPLLGADTDDVLAGELGMAREAIDALRAARVL